MSLFENDRYHYSETYFVMFRAEHRPTAEKVAKALAALDSHYVVSEVRADDEGRFEMLTLFSPEDNAAMDIAYLEGEDVLEHIAELERDFHATALTAEEKAKLQRVSECTARLDVFHFEEVMFGPDDEDEEMIDPGGLLTVLAELGRLCHGIALDQGGNVY